MQSRIPRQSDHGPVTPGADDDGGFSDELTAVVAGARRRALRDGDRQIDTAHLLHSLLEHDLDVRAAFEGGPQLARLLGYLVQRSIGYGLRWQSGVEDSGALPVVTPTGRADTADPSSGHGFSPLAAIAVRHARARALRRGRTAAHGLDLLASIVADPEARAVEVLGHAGVDAQDLLARVESGVEEYAGDGDSAAS
ncbi:Clp protease N-terminal domain-containing protein [Streptomyces sp. NPDC018693]|uniref:Clp protease N-terminal domain-containing protein n=1 Tax=unclassified Streptomyces TaxID=2593676 RepID=UPI0037BC3E06